MLKIKRLISDDKQTLGIMTLPSGKVLHTLELDWQDNKKRESCIPKGKYKVVERWSEKYGHHFHILDVPNRDMILIHLGNYHTDILGCILVGTGLKDINKDGKLDVTGSKIAMGELNKEMPSKFELEIV
jgi:hypothetical protein